MSTVAEQGVSSGMSQLVASIREVQAMQAQLRAKQSALGASASKAPPVTGLPTGSCANWMQTNDCKASGPLQVINGVQTTQSCSTPLQAGWSGYCACGSEIKVGFDCNGGQQGLTCAEVCKQAGASAYGPLPATDTASCLKGGGVFVGQGSGPGYAAAAPGTYFPGCPADAKCCVPLTGTINVSDATTIFVTGATGTLAGLNGEYKSNPKATAGQYAGPAVQGFPALLAIMKPGQPWQIVAARETIVVNASGAFAKDPARIPVGGQAEPWQSTTGGDTADAAGIRLSAPSSSDASADAQKQAEITSKLAELEQIETALLGDLRSERLAATGDASSTSLALRAEAKAASLVEAESEEQRRRLHRQRGQEVKDTTLIVAARSAAMRAKAYTRVSFVAFAILVGAFVIYRLKKGKMIGGDISFMLAVALGGAGLIIATIMLNNIRSRNPRDFSKLYFAPPAGPSSGAFSPPSSDNGAGSLSSCNRALRAAKEL